MTSQVLVGGSDVRALPIGGGAQLAFLCGPCVIESRAHATSVAEQLAMVRDELGCGIVFKSSYDKANRTSAKSYRGVGLEEGLKVLSSIRSKFGFPVVTDVHTEEEAIAAGAVVDLIQIPAFLCRQTGLLEAAGRTGKPVMIKKGQFLHPSDMRFAAEKATAAGSAGVLLCERGSCFGYRDLIVDMRSLEIMAGVGCPVVFDGTHSVQQMGGADGRSGGNRQFVASLSRAAVAVGVDAVFLECHDDPERAPSDGPNMLPLAAVRPLLRDLLALDGLSLQTRGAPS